MDILENSSRSDEDIIIEELQRGYHLNGRVLRHAMVKVSMGPGPTSEVDKAETTPDVPLNGDENSPNQHE